MGFAVEVKVADMNVVANTKIMGESSQTANGSMALRLFGDQLLRLGWTYWAFAIATIAVGLAALLPARFLQFFTEKTLWAGPQGQVGALAAFGLAAEALSALPAWGFFSSMISSTGSTLTAAERWPSSLFSRMYWSISFQPANTAVLEAFSFSV